MVDFPYTERREERSSRRNHTRYRSTYLSLQTHGVFFYIVMGILTLSLGMEQGIPTYYLGTAICFFGILLSLRRAGKYRYDPNENVIKKR